LEAPGAAARIPTKPPEKATEFTFPARPGPAAGRFEFFSQLALRGAGPVCIVAPAYQGRAVIAP
jgi:hypothetical protein